MSQHADILTSLRPLFHRFSMGSTSLRVKLFGVTQRHARAHSCLCTSRRRRRISLKCETRKLRLASMMIEPLEEEGKKLDGYAHIFRRVLLIEVRSSLLLSYLRRLTFINEDLVGTIKATVAEFQPLSCGIIGPVTHGKSSTRFCPPSLILISFVWLIILTDVRAGNSELLLLLLPQARVLRPDFEITIGYKTSF